MMQFRHAALAAASAIVSSASSAQVLATQDFESTLAGEFFTGLFQGDPNGNSVASPLDTFDSSGGAGLGVIADPTGSGRGNVGHIQQPGGRVYASWDFATDAGATFNDGTFIVSVDVYFPSDLFTMSSSIAVNNVLGNAVNNDWFGPFSDFTQTRINLYRNTPPYAAANFAQDVDLTDRWLTLQYSAIDLTTELYDFRVLDGDTGQVLFCDIFSFRERGFGPTEHATLDFRGGCCAATGSYYIDNLQVEDGSLGVCVPAPEAFSLESPIANGYVTTSTPTLDWADAVGADSYDIVISANADLSDPVVDVTGLSASEYTVPMSTLSIGVYYIEVTAVNGGGTSVANGGVTTFAVTSLCVADLNGSGGQPDIFDVTDYLNLVDDGCPE